MNNHQRHHFRVHQPYCLKRLPCGRHIFLNRDYKPLGLETQDFVRYEDFPRQSLPGLCFRQLNLAHFDALIWPIP